MNQSLEEKKRQKLRILVAPLDWGLGHATRCIPIIRELIEQGADVWLAGEGQQEVLLKTEFPSLPFLVLPGYRVRYASSKLGLLKNIIFQTPKILRRIQEEKKWLNENISAHQFDAVISDNRYGLYHHTVPCIFITHQLKIKSPLGKWTEKILQKRNYKYINRFTACWVPDAGSQKNLAGDLSHPENKPTVFIHYIGPLSRFKVERISENKDQLLIVLSGPEPQRTLLENKIITAIGHYNHPAVIVRGLPGSSTLIPSTNMIKFYNHLPAPELNKEMEAAEYIISRSGYSTVMDIAALQKKSILIPTPGQTEQEYLGEYLMENKMAYTVSQENFNLEKALSSAKGFTYMPFPVSNDSSLKKTIQDFLTQLPNPSLG
ncbi:hypothetical protein CAP36_07715 [Chitinophagaceae bacterium IBVUCB2]|nr:hypothetical protein CAP36_07715 [Chitinophagaceae bacterium IBVUCB2]